DSGRQVEDRPAGLAALEAGALMKLVDSLVSRFLKYDLSHTDVVKWVAFARQVLAVVMVSVILIAGLSAFLSIKQAEGLLHDSLHAQGRAIAESAAKAAFVPLTLEDDRSLASLVDVYRSVPALGKLSIVDAEGKTRQEL